MFDDIPEDKEESYPWPNCENGNVTLDESSGIWRCDICEFGELN